jgi:anaerobic selenocysteine-containing dehydrogenase
VLHRIHKDPDRKMIVVDPRRTETAALADLHLQVRPGTDAFLLAALLAVIVREGDEDRAFLASHTTGFDAVRAALLDVPIEAHVKRTGLALHDVYKAARWIADADRCAVRTDLGIEHTLHSTLNQYLRAQLFLLTGNFNKPGGNVLHTALIPLMGHSEEGERQKRSAVTKFPFITNLLPPNILPAEIEADHPRRTRGLVVDSANPLVSMPDTQAYRAAFAKLDLLVVIDVAMTETARLAHYVLPAASQFEKCEATFFNLDFPANAFQLRRALFDPLPGARPEPEIYTGLIRAMGALRSEFADLKAAAKQGRTAFAAAFQQMMKQQPELADYGPVILYETLGPTLPDGMAGAAFLWATAHQFAAKHPDAVRRAGHAGEGPMLGEALFEAILHSPSGVRFSVNEYEEAWDFLRHKDRRVHLEIPEMLAALRALDPAAPDEAKDYPFVLVAGERRSYNANTIYRDPAWRKEDPHGALCIHPADAVALGLREGGWVRCESKRGAVVARVALNASLLRGVITLPHGYGLEHPDEGGVRRMTGVNVNELTAAEDCDPIAGTPWHKHIPVRLQPVAG